MCPRFVSFTVFLMVISCILPYLVGMFERVCEIASDRLNGGI